MATEVQDQVRKDEDTARAPPRSNRRVVFISHANPEDNPAAAWFATQLTLLGYEVWCDLKNTHGGESDFWLKVQKVIENDAVKFVYILSNTSCDFERKKGIYKEVQAADNLRIDNFIIPVRIEKLTRSLPILLNTSIYISAENWAAGLHDLVERLREDGVPKRSDIDFEKISSWWPAIAVDRLVRHEGQEELVSNILPVKTLPKDIYMIRVLSEGNPITGFERLKNVLPKNPAFYAHGDYALSFAGPFEFAELTHGFDFDPAHVAETQAFITSGHAETGIAPDIARNIVTYLTGSAFESFLASKGLTAKPLARRNRSVWFARDGLLTGNRAGLAEPGKRKVSIQLVGSIKHYRKTYRWHFGLLPAVDLRVHNAIALTPKAIISLRYNAADGELPVPIDDKKVLRKLGWWNQHWRQKLLAMISWLADGQAELVIPAGGQSLVLAGVPRAHDSAMTFDEVADDDLINQAMEALVEHPHSS